MSDATASTPTGPGNAGSAFLEIVPTVAAGAAGLISAGLAGPLKSAAATLSNPAVAIGAALGAAITAGLGAAFDVAGELAKGQKEIRKLTGAVGSDLDSLGASMRNIVGTVAGQGIDRFAEAIGRVKARTGETGPALEELAKQELRLAKLTGSDLAGTIESTTRLFGDWGVSVEKQAGTLDMLYRASQATGVGVEDLSTAVVRFGAPFRQLGFSLEQSVALVGKFQREGVNTQLVLGSMRIALGKMARAGEEPVSTFRRLVGEIQHAGNAGEANAKSLALFGARAGPDMAAAIREGRFSIDDLLSAIGDTGGTLEKTERETRSWSERMGLLWQRASLWLEPVGKKMLEFRSNVIGRLETGFEALSKLMSGDTAGAGFDIGSWLGFDQNSAVVDALTRTFDLIRGFAHDITNGGIGEAFRNLGNGFRDAWPSLVAGARELLGRLVENLAGWAVNIGTAVADWTEALVSWVIDAGPALYEALGRFVHDLARWVRETAVDLADRVRVWAPALAAWAANAWDATRERLARFWANLSTWVAGQVDGLRDLWATWAPVVASWASSAWQWTAENLPAYFDRVRSWVTDRAGDLAAAYATWRAAATSWVDDTLPALRDRAGELAAAALEWLKVARDRIGEFLEPYLAELGAWVTRNAPKLLEQFHAWASAAGQWLAEAIPPLLEAAGRWLGALLTWLVDNGPKLVSTIIEWVPKLLAGLAFLAAQYGRFLVELWGPLAVELGKLLGRFVAWIVTDAVPHLLGALPEWIGAFVSWVPGAIVALLGALGGLLAALAVWVVETGLPTLGENLLAWAAAFVAWVPGAVMGLIAALGGLLGAVVSWVVDTALPGLLSNLLSWALAFVSWVITATIMLPVLLLGFIGKLFEFTANAKQWIIDKVLEFVPAFLSWIANAIAEAPGKLEEWAGMLLGWLAGMPQRIDDAAKGMFKGIGNAFIWAINAIQHVWNNLQIRVPELKVGDTVIFGGYTLDTPDIPDVPYLARGGRAVAPGLAVVGEAGAEVVRLARNDVVIPPAALEAGAGRGPIFGDVNITEATNVAAILARLDAELGWRVGTGANG